MPTPISARSIDSLAEEPVPIQNSPLMQRQIDSALLLMLKLLKNNINVKKRQAIDRARRYGGDKFKRLTYLSKQINNIWRKKCRMFMKSAWAALLTNQIQLFLANKTQNEKVKAELKSQTTLLMGTLIQKTLRQKTHEYFKHLRTQGVNKLKITRFKGTFMMGRISNLYHLKTKLGFEQLQGQCLKGRQKFQSTNILFQCLQRKLDFAILSTFFTLQRRCCQNRENQLEDHLSKNEQPYHRIVQKQDKIKLEKKRQLEQDLTSLQNQIQHKMTALNGQINALEQQCGSIKFSNDYLQENNLDLEREIVSQQRKSRKKLTNREIWDNVINNIVKFLSMSQNNKKVRKEELIAAMELPLAVCNCNIEELKEENAVLSDLLEQYKKNFSNPETFEENEPQLPYEIISRQNRYYYLTLEVLTQWGKKGSKQFEQLNNCLLELQNKAKS